MEHNYNRIEENADRQKRWSAIKHIGSTAIRKVLNFSALPRSKINHQQLEQRERAMNSLEEARKTIDHAKRFLGDLNGMDPLPEDRRIQRDKIQVRLSNLETVYELEKSRLERIELLQHLKSEGHAIL